MAEKTEQPTDKHLRDAREEGQVAKSQEISSTAVVLSMFVMVMLCYDWAGDEIKSLFLTASDQIGQPFDAAFKTVGLAAARTLILLSFPFVAVAAVAGVTGHLAQTGVMFAFKAAVPGLKRLNPKQWFTKTFSLKNLVEFLRSLLKIGVVCFVFYRVFLEALPMLMRLPGQGLRGTDIALRYVMWRVTLYCSAAFVGIAALDWLFQKYQFLKEHRMSKEDVKTEYKQMEGDPQVKGQRKQLHQEMVMNDQAQSVRRADVLVTNPTHLAIALEYDPEKTPLPVILAKGSGAMAERMIRIAEEAGVPIMRNVPLAHGLWEEGEELQFIPSSLIEPVAEVLRWLRELKEKGNP